MASMNQLDAIVSIASDLTAEIGGHHTHFRLGESGDTILIPGRVALPGRALAARPAALTQGQL